MVYIYKKIIQGRSYYYLRISQTIKGRTITKDVAYLGADVSKIEAKLTKLPKLYKNEIRKAHRNIKKFIQSEHYLKKAKKSKLKESLYLKKELLEEIEAVKLHFNEHFLKLDKKTITEVYKNFLIDFAFNTTSIEGNTITLAEASRLLKEHLTPKDSTLREIYDLQNTEKIFFGLLDLQKKINHEFIISIHDKLLEGIDERKGYRTHDIRVVGAHFKSSPAVYVKTDVDILIKWQEKNKNKFHPFVLAGIFHQKFEKIHPFADGNGRTGRMLINNMLLQNKYPPLIVRKSKRNEYLTALREGNKADLNSTSPKHYKKLIEYLANEMIWSYWNNFLV